jgi:hypothetical protein
LGLTPTNDTGITSLLVQQAGGIVIELLVDVTSDPIPLVDAWVTSDGRDLNCSVVHDKDGVSNDALKDMANREWAFVIDTSTMKIVWRAFGSTGNQAEEDSSAVQGLVEMCNRLTCP